MIDHGRECAGQFKQFTAIKPRETRRQQGLAGRTARGIGMYQSHQLFEIVVEMLWYGQRLSARQGFGAKIT